MKVIDLEGNEFPVQVTSTNDYELNGNQSLSFVISPNKVNIAFINDISEMWTVVDHDDVPHKIIHLRKRGRGDLLTVEIRAIPLFFDDLSRYRIYPRIDEHMTAFACFSLIFDDTDYDFTLVDPFNAVDWQGFGDGATLMELFKRALERYRAEFRIEGNMVYLESMVGRDTGFMYRYRLNASNIVKENDATAFYTYARGYGDYGDGEGGEDWRDAKLFREYTSPLANIPGIGIRHAPRIENGNITSVETMDERLKERVDESLKVSVSATIYDLRAQGYSQAQPEKGDRVFLVDERIGFNAEVRILDISLTRNWRKEVVGLSLVFGSPSLVKREQSRLDERFRRIEDVVEGREPLPYNVLPESIRRASEALLGALTELEINDLGIIARDVDDPNRLVIYNSAGLGVSTDGGQTFENAITYLGVNTKLLTAGDIHTNHIRLIGEDNYFYWNGEGLFAINPDDSGQYVRLDSNGLYIAKGALTIERPDGYPVISDGIQRMSATGFTPTPSFQDGTLSKQGRMLRNDNGDTEWRDVEAIFFNHVSRYIRIHIDGYVDDNDFGARSEVRARLYTPTYPTLATVSMTSTDRDNPDAVQLAIDMGVPDGSLRGIVIQTRSSSPIVANQMRIRYFAQEG